MTIFAQPPHFVSAASNHLADDAVPGYESELGDHLDNCQDSNRHMVTLRHAAQSVRRFIASRLVTTALVGVALLGLAVWLV